MQVRKRKTDRKLQASDLTTVQEIFSLDLNNFKLVRVMFIRYRINSVGKEEELVLNDTHPSMIHEILFIDRGKRNFGVLFPNFKLL